MTDTTDRGSGHLTEPPGPGAIRPFDFPPVDRERLGNGLQLRLARMPRLPVVSVTAVLNAGESWLGRDRAGLAILAADALEGGTEAYPGAAFAEALERLGADLSVSTGWDSTTVQLSCHADRLGDALPLLASIIQEPAFPEDEVGRVRSQRLAGLEQRKKEPSRLAGDRVLRAIFADRVPFSRPAAGLLEAVAAMGRDDVVAFTDEAYRPGDGGLVVAGDVDLAEFLALAREHFDSWVGEGRGWPEFEVAPRSRERRIVVVDRPGSVQSEIRMGHVGIRKRSDDYFPVLVFNSLLGGTFSSRLNQKLREERGFTYGVRSRFAAHRMEGPFTISTAVESAVTADAVSDTFQVLETFLEDGPTEQEVASARDYIVGVFPLRFETTDQVGSRVAELLVYDLPDDYHATYRDRVRAVTAEAALDAARRRLRPEEMVVVVVGDAARVREPLAALDLGPVEVVEVE